MFLIRYSRSKASISGYLPTGVSVRYKRNVFTYRLVKVEKSSSRMLFGESFILMSFFAKFLSIGMSY